MTDSAVESPMELVDNVLVLSAKLYTRETTYGEVDSAIASVAAHLPSDARKQFQTNLEELSASVRMGKYQHRGRAVNVWRQELVAQLDHAMAVEGLV